MAFSQDTKISETRKNETRVLRRELLVSKHWLNYSNFLECNCMEEAGKVHPFEEICDCSVSGDGTLNIVLVCRNIMT